MRAVADAGFETGVHTWDHVRWQDGVVQADADWTKHEMDLACDRYTDIFRTPPLTHGAAGWQMNVHALRLTQRMGFEYCSDGRGTHPHLPVWNAELIRCPQLPTTLPTMDELIGRDGVTEDNVAAHLLELTKEPRPAGSRVYASRRARRHAPRNRIRATPRRLAGAGLDARHHSRSYETLQPMALPRCVVMPGSVAGRSGTLLVQGIEFLGDVDLAAAA